MDKVTSSIAEILMQSWKAGWPEYRQDPSDDHPSIVKLASKIAQDVKVNIDDPNGLKRVQTGITNIASFCRVNTPWSFKNVFYANMCFQTLYNHMKSVNRMKQIRSDDYNYKK